MSLFNDALVTTAKAELRKHDGQFENISPLRERIGDYWNFLGQPGGNGADGKAWSAAFVSYMVNLAGAGSRFLYSDTHAVYVRQAIHDRLQAVAGAPFLAFRPQEVEIQPGDILAMNRGLMTPIAYDWAAGRHDYPSHADIVVGIEADGIHTVGGNVGRAPGQIGAKRFKANGDLLTNVENPNQQVFAVIRNSLP